MHQKQHWEILRQKLIELKRDKSKNIIGDSTSFQKLIKLLNGISAKTQNSTTWPTNRLQLTFIKPIIAQ